MARIAKDTLMNKQLLALGLLAGSIVALPALAKLPPPSDEAKAKAAETAAKAAWTDKVGSFQLCKTMDKVAVRYLAEAGKAGKSAPPTPTPPCADPGPFVHAPPVAAAANAPATTPTVSKPLEAGGAHSPPGNAVSPPSTKTPAAATAPAPVAAPKK